jgi:uncharacterized OB-fold protein
VRTRPLQHGFVAPEPDPDTAWWWKALAEDRLELPRCLACGDAFFPPQPACPRCGSLEWERILAAGTGTLYSWIVAHTPFDPRFAEDVPYTLVAVDLAEGARLVGRFSGEPADLQAGAALRAFVYRVEGQALVGFEGVRRPPSG